MSLTCEVEVWSIRQRKNRCKPFGLRCRIGDQQHSQHYRFKTQAEGRPTQLLEALRQREIFGGRTWPPSTEPALPMR